MHSPRAAALADEWLDEASASRGAPTHAVRALGWLALAQRRDAAGDAGGVLRACDRGLRALDEHQATLGSQELRAVMSGHGAALAELGTRTALASGSSRRLLQWSERWRATALVVPSSTAAHDPGIAADLAALRAQHHVLAGARAEGERTDQLQARVTRLEQSVRRRLLHARGTGETASELDVAELLGALRADDTVLVELAEVDGSLHALVAGRGRVRHLHVGDAPSAAAAVDFAPLLGLRNQAARAAWSLPSSRWRARACHASAARVGARPAWGTSRVVVSGSAAPRQGVPWGLLPALADGPGDQYALGPRWPDGAAVPVRRDRRWATVGCCWSARVLGSGGARRYPAAAAQDAVRRRPGSTATDATVGPSCPGRARRCRARRRRRARPLPRVTALLFSSLALGRRAVGSCRRPPAPRAPAAPGGAVGMRVGRDGARRRPGAARPGRGPARSMGTAGVVSSLAEVDDAATVEVMVALHAAAARGRRARRRAAAARQVAADDPVLAATAASFTVLGAARAPGTFTGSVASSHCADARSARWQTSACR